MWGIIGSLIGLALIIGASYLFTTGIAWVLIYLLGLAGLTLTGSVWVYGAILWIILLILRK